MRCVHRAQTPVFTKRPRGIGYWGASDDASLQRFPAPWALVRHDWLPSESRIRLLHYLRSGQTFRGYWGHSFCRFDCGASCLAMGSREYWDGDWVWPEGLAHYVECHNICLPEEFVARVLCSEVPSVTQVPAFPDIEVDWEYWLDWASQANCF